LIEAKSMAIRSKSAGAHPRAIQGGGADLRQPIAPEDRLAFPPGAQADVGLRAVEDVGGGGLGVSDQKEAGFLQRLAPGGAKEKE
jgi:hypothetical protein